LILRLSLAPLILIIDASGLRFRWRRRHIFLSLTLRCHMPPYFHDAMMAMADIFAFFFILPLPPLRHAADRATPPFSPIFITLPPFFA